MSYSILHISSALSFRGGERQLEWLHNGLLARDVRSCLFCRPNSELIRRCSTDTCESAKIHPAVLGQIISTVRTRGAQIIHCNDGRSLSLGAVTGGLLKLPVLCTRRVLFKTGTNFFSRWKYRQCAKLIAISTAVADSLTGLAPAEKIVTIHSGISLQQPSLPHVQCRDFFGLEPGLFVIGTVGHLTAEKGLPRILSLAQRLALECPDARVLCIGPMSEKERRMCSEIGNLITPGLVKDAVRYYSIFDLYISASSYEGLGTALLDAVVRDIPSIAVDAGGTRDIYPPQWPLIPQDHPEDLFTSIIATRNNYEQSLAEAKRAGRYAREKFSLEKMIERYHRLFQDIVSGTESKTGPASKG